MPKVVYSLEFWDPKSCRYRVGWTGKASFAQTMFNKSYNERHTRRLVKTTTEIIATAKAVGKGGR